MAALVEAFVDVLVRHVFFCAVICKGVCMWMTKVLGHSSVLFSECASIFSQKNFFVNIRLHFPFVIYFSQITQVM